MTLNVQSHVYVFANSSRSNLKITAKRYTTNPSETNLQGLTLLFTHCIGSHKEQWEPVIELLFEAQESKDETHRIREAWSFDWQNHGDAAVLNREALKSRPEGVSAYEWAGAIADFVLSPRMNGHRIVPIGHSAGAAAIMLSTKHLPPHRYPAMLLVEPTLVTRAVFNSELEDRMAAMDFAVAATSSRRDNWRSKEEAFVYFRKRIPWEFWDARAVQILVEYGLEDSDEPAGGVRLKCDRKQEAVSYPDTEPHFDGALQLARISRECAVHLIWGTRNDLVPEFIQDSLADASEGRHVASITKIRGAGHLVVQEQPARLAQAIGDILDTVDVDVGVSVDSSTKPGPKTKTELKVKAKF